MTIREHITLVEAAMQSDFEPAIRALLDAFVRSGGIMRDDVHGPEPLPYGREGMGAAVRYWGRWQVPAGEEDDGDYDWKELTPESAQQAAAIVAEVQQQFPDVELSFSQQEKEWIDLIAAPRKVKPPPKPTRRRRSAEHNGPREGKV